MNVYVSSRRGTIGSRARRRPKHICQINMHAEWIERRKSAKCTRFFSAERLLLLIQYPVFEIAIIGLFFFSFFYNRHPCMCELHENLHRKFIFREIEPARFTEFLDDGAA